MAFVGCGDEGIGGREPEKITTLSGVTVCRMVVVKRAAGPASSPALVGLYLKGALARRCGGGLHEGDLIEAVGQLASRSGIARPKYPEVVVLDAPDQVRLYERAGAA